MALTGAIASWICNAQALALALALALDGLVSGLNALMILVAARLSSQLLRPPECRYPFGYWALETLYTGVDHSFCREFSCSPRSARSTGFSTTSMAPASRRQAKPAAGHGKAGHAGRDSPQCRPGNGLCHHPPSAGNASGGDGAGE
ncbi:hypothetical protein FQK07_10240 [Synechococcus sp. BSF8S]|nr:hypothetical protein [Synechococcus sp. BSF8S]MBC1264563.1 hypothetical protein [Synechococcus sp. BSA11S]